MSKINRDSLLESMGIMKTNAETKKCNFTESVELQLALKDKVAGSPTTHKCTIIKQVNDGDTQKQPLYTKIAAIHARQDHCFETMSSHPANNANPNSRFSNLNKVLPVAIGLTAAGIAVAAVPIAVAAVGFGTGGIAAGSLAASMMSTAATSGIGMGAVATLQSVGAAGLAASTQILIGTAAGIGAVAAAQTKEAPPGKDSKGNNPLTKPDTPHWADGFGWRSATGIGMGAVAALQSVGAAGLAASTQILSGTAAGISRAAVAVAQTKETPPGKDSKGNNPTEKGPGGNGSRGSGSGGTGPGGDGTKEPFGRERAWWRW